MLRKAHLATGSKSYEVAEILFDNFRNSTLHTGADVA
jgi:hypothetical protein